MTDGVWLESIRAAIIKQWPDITDEQIDGVIDRYLADALALDLIPVPADDSY